MPLPIMLISVAAKNRFAPAGSELYWWCEAGISPNYAVAPFKPGFISPTGFSMLGRHDER